MALHGKLEYYTDIMRTLLLELMEEYIHSKNPKLMLRRSGQIHIIHYYCCSYLALKGTSETHFPQVVVILYSYSSWNVCKILPQRLCKTTTFYLFKTQLCSQRPISVDVSLNDNELLLTPPLSSVFCVFGGALPSKTKLIHCIRSASHVGRKWMFTFTSNNKTPTLLTRDCCR